MDKNSSFKVGAPDLNPVQRLLLLFFSFLFATTSPGKESSKWRIILYLRKRSCCPPPALNVKATAWKRQSGSENLEAITCDPYWLYIVNEMG